MARNQRRPEAASEIRLEPLHDLCESCGERAWVAYHGTRTVTTLEGSVRLRLVVRRCVNRECELYQESRRPEQEGAFALPQGEFGLEVIALVGALRHAEHRSVPEIHRELLGRGVGVSARTVTNLLDRYEELVALRLSVRSQPAARGAGEAGASDPRLGRVAAGRRPRGFVGGSGVPLWGGAFGA
jgi:hypothetical protein